MIDQEKQMRTAFDDLPRVEGADRCCGEYPVQIFHLEWDLWRVICPRCGKRARNSWNQTLQGAIDAWNARNQ